MLIGGIIAREVGGDEGCGEDVDDAEAEEEGNTVDERHFEEGCENVAEDEDNTGADDEEGDEGFAAFGRFHVAGMVGRRMGIACGGIVWVSSEELNLGVVGGLSSRGIGGELDRAYAAG